MAYQLVDFDSARKTHEAEIEKVKEDDSYGDGIEFDKDVLEELHKLVEEAMTIEADVHRRISSAFTTAKKTMDTTEAFVKKRGKSLNLADLETVKKNKATVDNCVDVAVAANKEAEPALKQWRADFVKGWRPLLSDPKLADAMIAPRAGALKNAAADAQSIKRLGEYRTRAADIQKLADQTANRGQAMDAKTQGDEIKIFTKKVTDSTEAITDEAQPLTAAISTKVLKPIEAAKKTKARPDLKTVQAWEKVLLDAETKAKPIRGQLKTFETLMVTFKKSAALFKDAQQKKAAAAAFASAAKQYKWAAATAKDLDKAQSNGKKALALAKKNVKK
jgi:hypothetical protein